MEHLLIPPHGNVLVNRVLSTQHALEAQQQFAAGKFSVLTLDEEEIKSVKNIARGVFSPLPGFMNEADFLRVVSEMRLADGTPWSIPFVLDCTKEEARQFLSGDTIALVNHQRKLIALLHVGDMYSASWQEVAQQVYGTRDDAHPGVQQWRAMKEVLVGGLIDLVDNTKEPFYHFNLDPAETRILFRERGWKTVVGFQTRNAPHRAHEYLQRCALELVDGLFIHPIIGKKKAGDFRDEVIISAYDYLIKNFFPRSCAVFSILPARMHYGGPREAILHAIIRKNFGCTHFVVGRDHAGVGDFYHATAAQEIFDSIDDLGIHILKFDHGFYCMLCGSMATTKTCGHDAQNRVLPSGTKIRKLLTAHESVPPEIMRPEIVDVIAQFGDPFVPASL